MFILFCVDQANPKFVEKVDNIIKRSNSTLGKLSISSRDNVKIEVKPPKNIVDIKKRKVKH